VGTGDRLTVEARWLTVHQERLLLQLGHPIVPIPAADPPLSSHTARLRRPRAFGHAGDDDVQAIDDSLAHIHDDRRYTRPRLGGQPLLERLEITQTDGRESRLLVQSEHNPATARQVRQPAECLG